MNDKLKELLVNCYHFGLYDCFKRYNRMDIDEMENEEIKIAWIKAFDAHFDLLQILHKHNKDIKY